MFSCKKKIEAAADFGTRLKASTVHYIPEKNGRLAAAMLQDKFPFMGLLIFKREQFSHFETKAVGDCSRNAVDRSPKLGT